MKKILTWRNAFLTLAALVVIFAGTLTVKSATTIREFNLEVQVYESLKYLKFSTTGLPDINGMTIGVYQGTSHTSIPVTVTNNGTVPVSPKVQVASTPVFGTVTVSPMSFGMLLPGASANFTIAVSASFLAVPGRYSIKLLFYED